MSGPRNQKPGAAYLCLLTTGPTYQPNATSTTPLAIVETAPA
jgi:hypothetical protein